MADSTHETKLLINGDSNGAVSALERVKSAMSSVGRAIGGVTKFLGQVNWAIQAISAIRAGIQKLGEFAHRAETSARNLREELERTSYANAVAHAAASYEKLNKRIAESVRLEKERSEILSARKSVERDLEDAQDEQKRQSEISELDPSANDYEKRKKDIDRKYDVLSSDRKAARADEDVRAKAADLYRAADAKDREADAIGQVLKKQEEILERAVEINFKAGIAARNGDEKAVEKAKETERAFQEAFDKAKKIREEMEKARAEAESIRRKAGEATGGNLSARILNEANKARIENERRAEETVSRKKSEEEAKTEADKKEAGRRILEDAKLERQKQEDMSKLDPKSKNYELERREVERDYEIKKLENKRDRANTEEERAAAEEELKALGIRHEIERNNYYSKVDANRADDIEQFADRIDAADGVSQNRLTAMGLGSGVSAKGDVSSDVRKLVDLLRENVQATKEIKVEKEDGVAVFGE